MKTTYYSILMALVVLLFAASSCGEEETAMMEEPAIEEPQVYKMDMDIAKPHFDEEGNTRVSGTSWETGDKIYFCFVDDKMSGVATYNSGSWEFTAKSGGITAGHSGTCRAYYFAGSVDESQWPQIKLASEQTAMFQSASGGSYSIGNDYRILVNVHLQPTVWRLRFKGTSGTQVTFESAGIDYYSAMDVSSGNATKSSRTINLTVASNGSTPFVYGLFNTTGDIALQLSYQGEKATYNRTLSASKLSSGKSGYFNLPTTSNLYGWTKHQVGPNFNGHDYVDLGLKDNQGRTIYWATCNIGASKPEDYGLYFAWGETVGFGSSPRGTVDDVGDVEILDGRSFDWANYKWMKSGCSSGEHITKYTHADGLTSADWYSNGKFIGDNLWILLPEDDAAHVNWGGDWRMPTKAEQDQLRTKCTWTWDNAKSGSTVKGPNGNSIFLPAAGFRENSYLLGSAGYLGIYWSSSRYAGGSDVAAYLDFDYSYVDWYSLYRYCGLSVRAVCMSSE